MANFVVTWAPVIGSVVVTVAAIFATFKVVIEAKNLRRRNVKELLDLIQEAGNRFEKESAKAWRDPEARPPKGSFEDSLYKDRLVSQIFGREITWYDWLEIRKFIMSHQNVSLSLLRYAWLYRDQTQAPPICFRLTWRICLSSIGYLAVLWVTLLFLLLGFTLMQFTLAPVILWLISLNPQLPKLLNSFGIYSSAQLLVPGLEIMSGALVILILNALFNYDGYAAYLLWKKTKPIAKQAKPRNPRGDSAPLVA
jgi:hypothetical protein